MAPDSSFQRGLAWASYYVLVFVALCVFNKPAMAEIIENSAPLFNNTTQKEPGMEVPKQWELRGTMTKTSSLLLEKLPQESPAGARQDLT